MPDTVLDCRGGSSEKANKSPCPGGADILDGKAAEQPTRKLIQKYQVVRRATGEIAMGRKCPPEGGGLIIEYFLSARHFHQFYHTESPQQSQEIVTLIVLISQIRKWAQRGGVTCPRSHSYKGAEPEFK